MFRHITRIRPIAMLVGLVDFARCRLKNDFVPGFNGQSKRIAIIDAVAANANFSFAIETGTYQGGTTALLAERFQRVTSIEINPRFLTFARMRLRNRKNVEIIEGDSATRLPLILSRVARDQRVFVYLDAHSRDLPLKDELQALESSKLSYLAAIDDFEIFGDSGYGHNSYARFGGTTIGPTIVFAAIPRLRCLWVPSAPSETETGKVRGTGFVASPDVEPLLEALERSTMLRQIARPS